VGGADPSGAPLAGGDVLVDSVISVLFGRFV